MHLLKISKIRVAPREPLIKFLDKNTWQVEVNQFHYLDYTWETYSTHATEEEARQKVNEMTTEIKRLKAYNASLKTWSV